MLTNVRQKYTLLGSHFDYCYELQFFPHPNVTVLKLVILDAETMIVKLLETFLPWWKNSKCNF